MAGKTAQYPSQYLHALQISTKRRDRSSSSAESNFGRLSSGDPTENGADSHTYAGDIAFAEDVAGHNFAGGKQIGRRPVVLHHDPRILIYFQAQIREGNAGTQRVADEGRHIDRPRPMR